MWAVSVSRGKYESDLKPILDGMPCLIKCVDNLNASHTVATIECCQDVADCLAESFSVVQCHDAPQIHWHMHIKTRGITYGFATLADAVRWTHEFDLGDDILEMAINPNYNHFADVGK